MLAVFGYLFIIFEVRSFELPACNRSEYLEPSLMSCQACPTNVSMVASIDGFSCTCDEHSVPAGISRCRPCNATEVISVDGSTCVPRKCQNNSGRVVCRKCPNDYISVTQNFDGSATKEVLCVKCARGFKAQNNVCVRCEGCACARGDAAVGGACVPKRFLSDRPKQDDSRIHPAALQDVLKHEYRCINGDILACRLLAGECVRNFYMTELAGPCRLWIQPKISTPKGLPKLLIDPTSNDFKPGEFIIRKGKNSLLLVVADYTSDGGFKVIESPNERLYQCSLPLYIQIGTDFMLDCDMNITKWSQIDQNSTFAPYLNMDGVLKPLPVVVRTPSDQYIQRGSWSSTYFRRYFLVHNFLLTSSNATGTVYLREMLVRLRIERDKHQSGSLRLFVSVEVRYASKSPLAQSVTTTLSVQHEMPSAGIFRGLEIWGGVLGTLLSLYAIVQWRGEMRRGGLHFSFVPLMAGSVSDALYFAAWFSTLHALAAEAGTLGMTLPLSKAEERVIRAFVYSAVSLKALKIAWVNWKQCRCDIFFLDWSEYNTPLKDGNIQTNDGSWRLTTLAREWSRLQTKRRAPPGYTVTLALLSLQVMSPWQGYLPQSKGYRWAVASIAWISSYVLLLGVRWALDRVAGAPYAVLPRVCRATDLSLLVFQEEYYAHYVHGRNEDTKDLRLMAGPLAMCRVVMAPQLRIVYQQLSTPGIDDLGNIDARRVVLTRLLAAFFERALDGLNWVASERTVAERLLDVEVSEREAGTTSVLLYDPEDTAPSCMGVTWWGEEWSLGTFDTMLFGCIMLATDDPLLAAFVTIVVWQIMKQIRQWFGNRNQRIKTNVDETLYNK
ncbi:hypothetical protein ABMA28_006121 [Loxostege sticticalis]|uniref:Meckelin n=1 Tax=Loxostege sticticalis TaxID=481309 RepID=A0ABD0SKC3_LOXSC